MQLGLAVLEEIAQDRTARTADRVSAARALATLCGPGRPVARASTAAEEPERAAPASPLSAKDATKRFRVV